ncbi:MAG: BREX-1 system phosphatase PglZ type A [Gordonibacter sp.]|uniref:BREX-1 system phosphatase PglZ type A n=1 Tax=Gordonibacter sp. TaxID=1968902 RepID=UPI002FCC0ED8
MDIDITEIENRLAGYFGNGKRLVFWEDTSGDYAEVADSIVVEGAKLLNVTKQEIASKRHILRECPTDNFVLYRCGDIPKETDDFLLDLKLAAIPFTCSMEGLWAEECSIKPQLAHVCAMHSRFFNSKERKARLRDTGLAKNTEENLRFAIIATCVGSPESTNRDAARDIVKRLLVEYAKGKQATLQLIVECGLGTSLWGCINRLLDYEVAKGEEPTIADLAYQMVLTQCAPLLRDNVSVLSNDAKRIMDTLAKDVRTRDAYEFIINETKETIVSRIDLDMRTPEQIGSLDALPDFDEWILSSYVSQVNLGALPSSQVEKTRTLRKYGIWSANYDLHYQAIISVAVFFEQEACYEATVSSKTSVAAIFETYCSQWYQIDTAYRRFFVAYRELGNGGRFKAALEETKEKILAAYNRFLIDLTDRWQLHLFDEEGTYPPASLSRQDRFFREEVEKSFPKAEKGRRVGVIVSDALRFEAGKELTARLNASSVTGLRGKAQAACKGAACMLPSYTQLGMAALLPDGDMQINPGTENVFKADVPTQGLLNRQRIIETRIDGSLVLKAKDVLANGLPDAQEAPLIYLYHNVIDARGDKRDTEGEAFEACDEAFNQIEKLVADLLRAGCGKVFITADHGFLYQEQSVEEYQYADVPNLSQLATIDEANLSHSRRYIVSTTAPQNDMLIEYAPAALSLEGDCKIVLPKGITRLRLRGSGARYVHGGASLQENAIPVVTVQAVKQEQAGHPTDVQGFACGRTTITGPTVSLTVYQTEPCSASVLPQTVKVGVYAKDEPTKLLSVNEHSIELSSASPNSDDRKTTVTLDVTNDIDDYASVTVRISKKIGNTNRYDTAWECEYSVNRAFGNDF